MLGPARPWKIWYITCNQGQGILWWGLCFILYVLGKTVLLRVISSNSSSILPVLHIQYSSHKHRLWSHRGQSRVQLQPLRGLQWCRCSSFFGGNIIEHYPVLVKLVYPRRGIPRPRPRRARWAAPGGIPRCWPGWADSSFSVDKKIWVSHDAQDGK